MSRRRRPDGIVIALDGPAGSGKSSTARTVAAELRYRHLDSGAFYRAITHAALEAGIPEADWTALTPERLRDLGVTAVPEPGGYVMRVEGRAVVDALRSPEVTARVSKMAAVPAVRDWLLSALRDAGRSGGLVADGRDIGTVVFPDAELKIFLVCAAEERARRRLAERGVSVPDAEQIRAEARRLLARDAEDAARPVAPLVRAPDAILLDTTALPFEAQVRAILRLARERCGVDTPLRDG